VRDHAEIRFDLLLKPFITDSTTIRAHTPTAMPIMETAELMPMKRLRRLARV
jgi:hypothetical protein